MALPLPKEWQCVLICWGTKYGTTDINRLVNIIADNNTRVARFVVLSDRTHENLDPRAETIELPEIFMKPEFTTAGACHAKLSMFKEGILKTDMPAIYIDLDTAVLGPIEQAFKFRRSKKSIVMFQSAVSAIFRLWLGYSLSVNHAASVMRAAIRRSSYYSTPSQLDQ